MKYLLSVFKFFPDLALLKRSPFGPIDRDDEPPVMKVLGRVALAWVQFGIFVLGGVVGAILGVAAAHAIGLRGAGLFLFCFPAFLTGATLVLLPIRIAIDYLAR